MKEKRGERKENEDERKKINMKDKKEKVKKEDERKKNEDEWRRKDEKGWNCGFNLISIYIWCRKDGLGLEETGFKSSKTF